MRKNDLKAVRLLIEKAYYTIDYSIADSNGYTVLIQACLEKNLEMVKVLSVNSELDLRSRKGWTALLVSAADGEKSIVKYTKATSYVYALV